MIYVNTRFLSQPITGVQRFAIEISLQLKKLYGDEITFLAPRNILLNDYTKKLCPIIIGNHVGHLWEQFDLAKYMKNRRESILLCLCNTSPILIRNKLVVLHDITFIRYPRTFAISFRIFYRVLLPLTIKTSRIICSVSEFSAKEISDYYNYPGKIYIVYNAVNPVFTNETNRLKKDQYLLAVSSFKENKNFSFILDVFNAVSKKCCNIKLYIVGDLNSKNFKTINIDSALKNENVRVLGRVTDVDLIKLYSNARAFLFPSLYEGFGIPVLEAQACGCPVIASNTSSLPEVLGESALLLPPDDKQLWYENIVELCGNDLLKERLVSLGLKNIQRFSWEKSAEVVANAISVCCDGKKKY